MTQALADFLGYWESEGATYARRGDYDWMAAQIPAKVGRVLEIGCGLGFGTRALVGRGLSILALDILPPCLAAARERLGTQADQVCFLEADLADLSGEAARAIADFRPEAVLCWLMGAPQETSATTVTATDAREQEAAVAAYRERMQRHAAQLAASLPEVGYAHFVDRSAIPWQAKDLGRDMLMRHHLAGSLADLPFTVERPDTQYRKLETPEHARRELTRLRRSLPALNSVTPVLASLLARRAT
ncbi:MAG: class I SAM-dependent methyltransferase [Zoogloeaceae bacterium]|nr:class I SAM-dependent methyltransferase [Zoogloeaceae bacterium]